MSTENKQEQVTRRDALKTTGQVAAASALAGVVLPQVHAGANNTIQVALVGCGGRGTGAAINALSSRNGPTRLVAMADVFQDRLNSSYASIQRSHAAQTNVPMERRFVGFDGYRRAMDSLNAGDVVILATPPAFRWVHFAYALQKNLHVFMEKPVTVDGPSTRRFLEIAEQSERRGTKVGVGLMCRHCPARGELARRVHDGAIGDLVLMRAYRMAGPTGSAFAPAPPQGASELMHQIRHFHGFLWASGGAYSDFLIHNIDEVGWMKNAWPVSAKASGGRHYRGTYVDQNLDTYSTEYTFADGSKFFLEGRTMQGCHQEFATYIHGARGSAIVSSNGHTPARPRLYRGQNFVTADITWRYQQDEGNPYQHEWDHLLDAIRNNRPYNEARRGAEASLVTAMGRMAAHSGRIVTRDEMLACTQELGAGVDQLTLDGPSPLRLNSDRKYPVPQPGELPPMREF